MARLHEEGTLSELSTPELCQAQTAVTETTNLLAHWNAEEMAMTVEMTNGDKFQQVVTPTLLTRISDFTAQQLNTRYGCDD